MADSDYNAALSRNEVLQALECDLGTRNFQLIDYTLRPASDNPMGFLGVHIKIRATVEMEQETKILQYFVKKIPVDIPSHNAYALNTKAFFKEIRFYNHVVQDIKRNMNPHRKLRKWCPEFYFSRAADIFIVEDMTVKGYYMYPERTLLDLEHVVATVRAMAAMHAGPLILEEKLKDGRAVYVPEGWTEGSPIDQVNLYPDLNFETEANGEPGHMGNIFYEAGIKSQRVIVDLLPNFNDQQKENIKRKLPDVLRQIFTLVKPSTKYRNTWIHGDLWSNNVLFHDGCDGKVDDAVLIDFQLARIAPPAHDFIMFLHLVQTRDFRDRYLSQVRDEYYAELTKELAAEDIDVRSVLPMETFIESCSYYYEYSLISQVLYYQMILTPPTITSKFLASPELFDLNMLEDRSEMVKETFLTDQLCRTRITEAMTELIEFKKLAD